MYLPCYFFIGQGFLNCLILQPFITFKKLNLFPWRFLNSLSVFPQHFQTFDCNLTNAFPHINQINAMFALCPEIMGAHREGLYI